jgi:hypothetical protein
MRYATFSPSTGPASDAMLGRYIRDGELFTDNAAMSFSDRKVMLYHETCILFWTWSFADFSPHSPDDILFFATLTAIQI